MGGLGRRGGGTSPVMNWGGRLVVFVVPRLRACCGVALGAARGDEDWAGVPMSDHAFAVVGELRWPSWCRGELVEGSAGDGRWAYL